MAGSVGVESGNSPIGIVLLSGTKNFKSNHMPVSNDNQDYSNKENKESSQGAGSNSGQQPTPNFTSDDLKGKQKVDADIDKEKDRPADTD